MRSCDENFMHVHVTAFNGNPNVGLYGFATDEYCLIGNGIPAREIKMIKEALKVPVHKIMIAGTDLVGAFVAGNSRMMLVPEITFPRELKVLDKLGIEYTIIHSRLTALGNTILCDDHGAIVSREFSADQKKKIRQALNVKLKPGTLGELDTVGSCGVITKRGGVLHRDATKEEVKKAEGLFGVELECASVNMGNPHVSSGIIANSNGFIVGKASGGPEVNYIDAALGFLSK